MILERLSIMRLHSYRFPSSVDEQTRLSEGCSIILKSGDEIYPDSIPEDKRHLVDRVDDTLTGITITAAKKLLKTYGGIAWTDHIDRDGSCFEVSMITLNGNNSQFKYNHHL